MQGGPGILGGPSFPVARGLRLPNQRRRFGDQDQEEPGFGFRSGEMLFRQLVLFLPAEQ
jgi:hypothetical protein